MLAESHTRPKHQEQASRKGKERMEEPDLLEEEDDLLQTITYDAEIIPDDPEQDDEEDSQAVADEEQDFMYGHEEVVDHNDEMEMFDIFDS